MNPLEVKKLTKQLELTAYELRKDVIDMLDVAGSGHLGGAFSIADIVTSLYFHIANIDPQNPQWEDRDYILLSNGHVCPILYAALAKRGFFPKEELKKLRKIDSLLQGHPKLGIPGIENTSGLLGQGLSQGLGIALGLYMDRNPNKVFVITSDGEHQEGQTWEAVMATAKWNLNNVVVIVDRNQIQIDGFTEEIMPLSSLKEKYESFGWTAIEIDGHNYAEILPALAFAKNADRPVAIIAHTVASKGAGAIEGKYQYHDWKSDPDETKKILAYLETKISELKNSI